jgi:hypothetical protein
MTEAKPGDCIVFKRADGVYDISKIDRSRRRVLVRAAIQHPDSAHMIAQGHLEGGRVLYSQHQSPDALTVYRTTSDAAPIRSRPTGWIDIRRG